MSRIEDAQHIQKPYYGFVVDKINLIYYTWDAGEDVLALIRAYKLCAFLVRDIRKDERIRKRIEAIEEGVEQALDRQGITYFSRSYLQNRHLKAVAEEHLHPFIIELMDVLDSKGYIEYAFGPRIIPTQTLPEQKKRPSTKPIAPKLKSDLE